MVAHGNKDVQSVGVCVCVHVFVYEASVHLFAGVSI